MPALFITGGSGFIGTNFVKHAIAAGYNVHALTRSEKSATQLHALGAQPVSGDLLVAGPWQEQASQCEMVVHLAQPDTYGAKVTGERARNYREQRLKMDTLLLGSLRPEVVRRVIYIAGTSYYGDQGTELRDEDTKPNPKGWGPYIAPAIEALEGYVAHGIPLVQAYPGWVYGPGSWFAEYQLAPLHSGKPVMGLTGRSPIASIVHYDDVARAILFLLEHGEIGKRYFIVDDRPIPESTIVENAAKALGVPPRFRTFPRFLCRLLLGPIVTESMTCDFRLSNRRLRELGFDFEYPTLEQGIPPVVKEWLELQNSDTQTGSKKAVAKRRTG